MKTVVLSLLFMIMCAVGGFAQTDNPVLGKHAEQGLTCVDCHKVDNPVKRAPDSSCKECHADYPEIGELTKSVVPNPHAAHVGDLRCTICHKVHVESVLYCNDCHEFDLKMMKNDIKYPKCQDYGETMKFVAQFSHEDVDDCSEGLSCFF